jgi:hypothetical protein
LSDNSALRLVLSLELGKTEQRVIDTFTHVGSSRPLETVRITQRISRIRIELQGRMIWGVSAVSADPEPMLISMRHNTQNQYRTLQEMADELIKPDMAIFTAVRLPAYLVKPPNPMYQGASELTSRGFVDKDVESEPPRPNAR